MKKRFQKALSCALTLPLLMGTGMAVNTTECKAQNPIVQTLYTADPAPMVYDGTLYLYTSHDNDGAQYYEMTDWRCYSTTDMQNWTDLGSPMSYKTFSWATGDAWAGQCIERNGKFYYYVPVAVNGATAIGVGVADSPAGPFKDAIGKPLIAPGYGNIDPTVYVDSDGQAYLYWGNPSLKYVKLNKDMVSYSGSVQTINLTTEGFGTRTGNADRKTLFEEGPWFYKRGNLYYMIYAASGIPENICYSTSTGPTGPWTYRGMIMPSGGGSFTNHPGIIDYKGHSYFFYHNGQLPGGNGFQRSVAVEEFKYNPDGSIPTISMTKDGAPQIGTLNPYVRNEAETICWESGVETEPCGEGTQNVGFIENGDYIMVKGVNFGDGAKSFEARVASYYNGGNIEIHLDSLTGKLVGTCKVDGTGAWQTYETKTCSVSGATGIHDVYFKFTGGSGSLFNFNWWKFNAESGTQPTVAPTTQTPVSETPATTAPATTAPVEGVKVQNGWYYIKNVLTEKYLQVKDNVGANAQNVEIWTGNQNAGQQWYVENREDGTITLKSALGDYMMDVDRNLDEDGTNIQIYEGWAGTSQRYVLKESQTKGAYGILTKTSNETKALDVYDYGKSDGTNVCQWSFGDRTNQQWIFEPVSVTPVTSTVPSAEPSAIPSTEPVVTPSVVPAVSEAPATEGIDFAYEIVSDWGGSFQGQITVTNKSDKTYNGWTLTCNYNSTISNLWGAELVGQTGTKVTIKNPSWDAALKPGQSVTINFIANAGSNKNAPTDYVLQ